jgi:neutral ceramidase
VSSGFAAIDAFCEAATSPARDPSRVVGVALPTPRSAELPEVPTLLAGAAEVDITPPPGMPKSGHSKNAQDGTGFRTRLRARVVHLRAGRVSLALVAGDLHAGSAVVHRLVGEAVAAGTDIPLAGLFLGATHTHAGPGQFHGSDFYNRWASNRPGLDPAYTSYLAGRIADAVVEAHRTRRPARLATGATEVWGFTRNRSLAAHVRNGTVTDKRTEAQRRYTAVNPWLHLLRVDAEDGTGGGVPLAALAVFSIHGTGISRRDPAYNADVWAYITGEMARGIAARTGTPPVCGAVEGTHGDMTPAVRPGLLVYPEAERVGRGIGAAAADLHARLESRLTSQVSLGAGITEVDLRDRPLVAGVTLPDPAVGAAKLAGAVENATPVVDHIPPFRPGFPKPGLLARSPQGRKWVFGGRALQRRFAPGAAFPHVLPVQVLIVGPMALVGLPFEVTVEAGRRIEAEVAAAVGITPGGPGSGSAGLEKVVVSSAANDYWDYLTTPEEYDLQFYEGASNLYGPRTLAFVAATAAALGRRVVTAGVVDGAIDGRRFQGVIGHYLAGDERPGSGPRRLPAGSPTFAEADRWQDAYWEFTWSGGPPGSLRWDRPIVRVERELGAGRWEPAAGPTGPVDDQGWRLGVFHLGPAADAPGSHLYAARWYQPPLGAPGRHRFVLEANHGHGELAGDPFD